MPPSSLPALPVLHPLETRFVDLPTMRPSASAASVSVAPPFTFVWKCLFFSSGRSATSACATHSERSARARGPGVDERIDEGVGRCAVKVNHVFGGVCINLFVVANVIIKNRLSTVYFHVPLPARHFGRFFANFPRRLSLERTPGESRKRQARGAPRFQAINKTVDGRKRFIPHGHATVHALYGARPASHIHVGTGSRRVLGRPSVDS